MRDYKSLPEDTTVDCMHTDISVKKSLVTLLKASDMPCFVESSPPQPKMTQSSCLNEQAPYTQAPAKQTPSKQFPSQQAPSKKDPSMHTPPTEASSGQTQCKQAPFMQAPSMPSPSIPATIQASSIQTSSMQAPSIQAPSIQTPSVLPTSEQAWSGSVLQMLEHFPPRTRTVLQERKQRDVQRTLQKPLPQTEEWHDFKPPPADVRDMVITLVEYWMSDAYALSSRFWIRHMRRPHGMSVKLITCFKEIVELIGGEQNSLSYCLAFSERLSLTDDFKKVSRKQPLPSYDETMGSRCMLLLDLTPELLTAHALLVRCGVYGRVKSVWWCEPSRPLKLVELSSFLPALRALPTPAAVVEFESHVGADALQASAEQDRLSAFKLEDYRRAVNGAPSSFRLQHVDSFRPRSLSGTVLNATRELNQRQCAAPKDDKAEQFRQRSNTMPNAPHARQWRSHNSPGVDSGDWRKLAPSSPSAFPLREKTRGLSKAWSSKTRPRASTCDADNVRSWRKSAVTSRKQEADMTSYSDYPRSRSATLSTVYDHA